MKLTTRITQAIFNIRQALIVMALTLSSNVNAAPPSITIGTSNLNYTENMPLTQFDPVATLSDSDGDTDWDGGSLVVQITGNSESSDEISIPDNIVGTINTSGFNIQNNATVIGTLSSSEGTVTDGAALTITFNASATNALVQQVLQGISYRNLSDDPSASDRIVTFTATDKIAESASDTQTIVFTTLNDQPTLSATADNPTFTEGDSAVSVFSNSSTSTVESGQTLSALTLTIMNVSDGSPIGTDETLFIDGSAILLTNNNSGTTTTNSLTYDVSFSGITTMLSLIAGSLSETEMQSLIDNMTYLNSSEAPNESDRVITLTELVDSGSNSEDNANSTSLTITSTITIESVNDEPTITIDNALTTDEDNNQSLTFTFTDVDGDTVSATVTTQASHGVASVSGTTVTYTPDANFNGSDSFTLTLTDGAGFTTTQVISVTVNSVNDEPTITIDSTLTTDEDNNQSLSFTFTDIDGDTVSASVTTQADHGVASVSGTTISYVPDANFNGSDSFTLTLTDGAGYTTTQTISVTVNSVNDVPTITIDSTLTTDEDNNQSLTFTFTDIDGDTVSASVTTQANHGVASVSGTTVTYAPDANFNGSDSFTLTLTDGAGYTTTQVISVTVNSSNDEPTITIDSTLTTDEDNNQSLTFTFTDVDGDTVSASVTTQADHGVASVSGTTISYVPDANFNGSDSFTLTLTDGAGFTTTQVISVTVNSVNDEPTITIDSTLTTDEDNNQSLSFTFTDIDGDTVSASVTTQADHGVASVSGTTISYAPDANFNGSDSFTLTLTDGAGYTTTQVISVTVNSSNDEPTITIDSTLTTDEDNNQSLTFTFTDVDGDTVSASVTTQADHGVASVSGTTISYVPDANFNGSDSFTLTLTDGAGYTTTQVISVTVNSVNDEPTITIDSTLTTDEDNNQSLTFTFTDVDGDTVSATVSTQANHGVASVSGTTVTYSPDANFNGSDSFTLSLTDGAGFTTTQVISVTVNSVNDDPTISIANTLITDEDSNQTLTFTYNDVDGDTVSASVSTQANHGIAVVVGTTVSYAPDANFNGSDSFTLTLIGSDGYTTTQTITVTVNSINDEPMITIANTLTTDEDNNQTLIFTYSDVDGDTVSAVESVAPVHGTISIKDTTVLYSPDANFNGSDSFTLTLTDSAGFETNKTIIVNVDSVNDIPIAVDDQLMLDVAADNLYQLDILANDISPDGDSLVLIGVSASIGEALIENNKLVYQAPIGTEGIIEFDYAIKDVDAEIVTAKVSLQLLPVISSKINLILPDDVIADASGLFTQLDLGLATAVDPLGKAVPLSIENGNSLYPTGNSLVHWKADDGEGHTVMLSQRVKINPLISIDKDQNTAEGANPVIAVHLNGTAPDYPVRVTYTVSGTADASDHNLTGGELVIEEGTTGFITLSVYEDAVVESNETIVVRLSSDHNLGNKSEHTLTIVEGNLAPKVVLKISQANEQRSLVTNNNDLVTVHAIVSDANPDDIHRIEWSTTHNEIPVPGIDQNEFNFDPSVLVPGVYKLTARVIDNGTALLETTQDVYFEVVTTLALLRSVDSDGDLIPDNQEGYIDTDGDGIADYLDAISQCNVLQEQALVSNQFLIEAEPGVCLRKGITVASNETGGSQLLKEELLTDDEMTNISGLFDFMAYDLKTPGQNITLVIPQRLPIPEAAVYRKLRNGQWSNFIEDENNMIHSAAGQPGYCPPPNHPTWSAGLSLGHWCVQLTIQDGGANDADGHINSAIVDPGGIAISASDNHAPVATADDVTIKWKTSKVIDVLSNDTDEDDDVVSISAATVDYGEVSFENAQLVYTTSDIFFERAIIQYSITDQNGGSAHSTVTVQVVNNFAPVAFDDSASTDDRGTVNIDVLGNDLDADGDQLTIIEVAAEHGDVVINADQTLTYSAQSGFDGVDTISYTIVDEKEATAQGTVTVTVTAFVIAEVKNSSGGSMGSIILLLTSIALLCRNRKIAVSLLLAVIFSVNAQAKGVGEQSQWLIEVEYGYSQAENNKDLDDIPPENIESIDSEDTAWSVGLGYLLTPEWKVVGRFVDLGTGSATLKAETLDPDEYHQSAAKATPLLVRGFAVDVSYQLFNFADIVSDAAVGTILWERDFESSFQGNSIKRFKSGTDMYLGVQMGYQLNKHLQLGVSYNHYFISENGIDTLNVRATYRF
ncbi:Ig-like domain-containing protein [Colwellia psychrerythraea]|uniref:Outer membrane adhesin like protein n=1 Tax=Colwellia psychrerythraea TaxID=28229 RepID=A0A099KHF6_COLPS|nr:Ig-like domain-containing protein [Colwellia psychrerythraea]KGJ89670.1 outer membrane adhesin like protein [Colwellia psychrerythraea]